MQAAPCQHNCYEPLMRCSAHFSNTGHAVATCGHRAGSREGGANNRPVATKGLGNVKVLEQQLSDSGIIACGAQSRRACCSKRASSSNKLLSRACATPADLLDVVQPVWASASIAKLRKAAAGIGVDCEVKVIDQLDGGCHIGRDVMPGQGDLEGSPSRLDAILLACACARHGHPVHNLQMQTWGQREALGRAVVALCAVVPARADGCRRCKCMAWHRGQTQAEHPLLPCTAKVGAPVIDRG